MWKVAIVSMMILVLCTGCAVVKDLLKELPISGITIGQDTTVVTYSKTTSGG